MVHHSPVLKSVFRGTTSNIKIKMMHSFTMYYITFPKLLTSSSCSLNSLRLEIFSKINLDKSIGIHKNNIDQNNVKNSMINILCSFKLLLWVWSLSCSCINHCTHKINTATTYKSPHNTRGSQLRQSWVLQTQWMLFKNFSLKRSFKTSHFCVSLKYDEKNSVYKGTVKYIKEQLWQKCAVH